MPEALPPNAPAVPPAPVISPAQTAKTPSKPLTLLEEIERWFADHFHNSVISRNTDAYNHVLAAKDDLIKRVKAF